MHPATACLSQGLLALALAACAKPGPPSATSPELSVVSPGEVEEAQRSASELALVAELLAQPEPIHRTPAESDYSGRVACEKVSLGPLHQTLGLRFGPGEPPFAEFGDGMLRVVVPPTDDGPWALHVTSDDAGIVVHGAVDPREITWYAATPVKLAGFVMLGSKAPLGLERASMAGLLVRYELGASDTVTTSLDAVRGAIPCAELELELGDAEAEDGLERPATRIAGLERAEHIPLSLVAGGPPIVELRAEDRIDVGVLLEAGRFAKVAISRSKDMLVGWIPSRALGDAEPIGLGHIGVLGHGAGSGTGRGFGFDNGTATCPHDVPIDAEHRGRRRRVGFVRRDTLMYVVAWRGPDVRIDVSGSKVRLLDGAELLVERSALEGCRLRLEPKTLGRSHRPIAWPRTAPLRPGLGRR